MKAKLLYLFPNCASSRLSQVDQGLIPSERLYGLVELRNRGWDIAISDSRWEGSWASFRRKFKRFFELPNLASIKAISEADVVVVKDEFSATLLAEAKLAGKPLVYLDAMFELPYNFIPKNITAYSLKNASAVCCYSKHQATQWAEKFDLPLSRFEVMPYCIDVDFYHSSNRAPTYPPYIISVGRDLGRDYDTLISVCEKLDINLKLVTLPYLLSQRARCSSHVEIIQNISYAKLFDLYARSAMSVIPLKRKLTYPSGVRAMLESAILGIPTIVTKTMVLTEYLKDVEHVHYVNPESLNSLENSIISILKNAEQNDLMSMKAAEEVKKKYSMNVFCNRFELLLNRILGSAT